MWILNERESIEYILIMYTAYKMAKSRSNKRKITKRRRRTFVRSRFPPRRSRIMRGGNNAVFPATFTNSVAAGSPQSYLPYNNFSDDPGYSSISSRNTGPFLTGGSRKIRRGRRISGGGSDATNGLSNIMNNVTNSTGLMPVPFLNESSGVAGAMSGFSNTSSVYSSAPMKMVPLA